MKSAVEEEAAQSYFKAIEQQVQKLLRLETISVEVKCLRGHPAQQIVECAGQRCFRPHCAREIEVTTAFFSRLLGGTAGRVSDHAKCDVLIVKGLHAKTLIETSS